MIVVECWRIFFASNLAQCTCDACMLVFIPIMAGHHVELSSGGNLQKMEIYLRGCLENSNSQ